MIAATHTQINFATGVAASACALMRDSGANLRTGKESALVTRYER
jgi:hypothetical protein